MPKINLEDALDEEELEEYESITIATSSLSMEHVITSIIQMSGPYHDKI